MAQPNRTFSARHTLSHALLAAGVLVLCACGGRFRSQGKRVELQPDDAQRLEAFLAELYATDGDRAPLEAALRGREPRVPGWDDLTQDRAQRERAWLLYSLERLEEEFTGRAPREEQILRDAARQWLQTQLEVIEWRHHADLLSDADGAHRLPTRWLWHHTRPRTPADWQNYVALLDDLPRYLGQVEEELQRRRALRTLPPRSVLLRARTRCLTWMAGRPFTSLSSAQSPWLGHALDQLERSTDLSDGDRNRVRASIDRALLESVGPAYQSFAATLDEIASDAPDEVAAQARTDGTAWYAHRLQLVAGTPVDPADWHARGIRHVATLRNQVRAWQRRTQRSGTLTRFLQELRESEEIPRAVEPLWAEAIPTWLRGARSALAGWYPQRPLPELGVQFIPRDWDTGLAPYRYTYGTLRLSPGPWVSVPSWLIQPMLAGHSYPGSHLRTMVSAYQSDLPPLLRDRVRLAWSEGWSLYAGGLALEWEWYAGPEQELGQMLWELWNTACAVVDTGLHHEGWSEQEAEEYLLKNSPFRRSLCAAAVRDCVERPGLHCAALVGWQQIVDLRSEAELALGTRFEEDAFHRALLRFGPLPPTLLTERMQLWLQEKQP